MKKVPPVVGFLALLVVGLVPIAPSPSYACWNADRTATAESPSWWTLSDEISPPELRRRCLDLDAHRQRYREDVLTGGADALSEQRMAELSLFVDGARTPELVPAWRAFATLADAFDQWPERAPDAIRRALAAYGFGDASYDHLVRIVEARARRAEEIEVEVGEDFMWLEGVSARARAEGHGIQFEAAARRGDVDVLARLSRESPESLQRGLRARRTRPDEVSAVEAIVALRQQLGETEWAAFRSFLFEQVAVGLRATGFEVGGLDPAAGRPAGSR